MVDDLNHLVKGGRLSNGAAILGNLLSIKPILYFNEEGVIEVYEKVRTEKKAIKRLAEIVKEGTADKDHQIIIIHGNALDKAETLRDILHQEGFAGEIPFATFGSVIGTHLGNHSVAISFVPKV
jgi:DegV family protein